MRVTYVADRYDETIAAYERLGFERLPKGTARGALFRAGPALVEVVDGEAARTPKPPRQRGPAGSDAVPTGSRT